MLIATIATWSSFSGRAFPGTTGNRSRPRTSSTRATWCAKQGRTGQAPAEPAQRVVREHRHDRDTGSLHRDLPSAASAALPPDDSGLRVFADLSGARAAGGVAREAHRHRPVQIQGVHARTGHPARAIPTRSLTRTASAGRRATTASTAAPRSTTSSIASHGRSIPRSGSRW
jgi:hypothetical protein